MICTACGSELPSAFPGATVTCVCGASQQLPQPASRTSQPSLAPSSRGPYRTSSALPLAEGVTPCPYCGNGCPPLVRVCPHCDVRLDSVRCTRCFTLQAPGSFSCGRCGQALELEAVLDATDAPCPRCGTALETATNDDARVHECARCGGMFVPRSVLAEILSRAEIEGPIPPQSKPLVVPLDQVKYIPCPLCHTQMNRVNFGRSSGVIVDVCRSHGTWFDAGELTRTVAFAASGGLAKSRKREEEMKREEQAYAHRVHAELSAEMQRAEMQARVGFWQEFLNDLFLW